MNKPHALHPPLKVWKLALLLLGTATLYQFVWLHRLAEDLRASREPSITPWHWAVAPFLGPFFLLPAQYLASYLKNWQQDSGAEVGHFAEPVMVGMLVLIAYLPVLLLIVNPAVVPIVLLVSTLLVCLAYLALQGQLNLIKGTNQDPRYSSTAWKYTRNQALAAAAGGLVAIPLYVLMFTNAWVRWNSAMIEPSDIVSPDSGYYRLHIDDDGWSRVGPESVAEDADLELIGSDALTWAVTYDMTGFSVDSTMASRLSIIREDFGTATCFQSKNLIEDGWIVRGVTECTGRSALHGHYLLSSRVLRKDQKVVEIVSSTSHPDRATFEEMANKVHSIVEGLEMTP